MYHGQFGNGNCKDFCSRADKRHNSTQPVLWSFYHEANLITDKENYFFFVKESDSDQIVRTFGFAKVARHKIRTIDQRLPWLDIKHWHEHIDPKIEDFWNIEQIISDFDNIF